MRRSILAVSKGNDMRLSKIVTKTGDDGTTGLADVALLFV